MLVTKNANSVTIVTNELLNSLIITPNKNPPSLLGKYVIFCIGK